MLDTSLRNKTKISQTQLYVSIKAETNVADVTIMIKPDSGISFINKSAKYY